MARSLGLNRVPTLDPNDTGDKYASKEYVTAVVRAINQNFEIMNSSYQVNTSFLDNSQLGQFTGAFTSYNTAVTQLSDVTFTPVFSKYMFIGRMVIFQFQLNITGSGTSGNNIRIRTPTDMVNTAANPAYGAGYIYDASVGFVREGVWAAIHTLTDQLHMFIDGNGNVAGVTPAFGLANGDAITGFVIYEADT